MATYHVTFDVVKARREVKRKCSRCGKSRKRIFTVENTINPFNKNAQGFPKSATEVRADVEAQVDAEVAAFNKAKFVCCE